MTSHPALVPAWYRRGIGCITWATVLVFTGNSLQSSYGRLAAVFLYLSISWRLLCEAVSWTLIIRAVSGLKEKGWFVKPIHEEVAAMSTSPFIQLQRQLKGGRNACINGTAG